MGRFKKLLKNQEESKQGVRKKFKIKKCMNKVSGKKQKSRSIINKVSEKKNQEAYKQGVREKNKNQEE